jgi:membrane-bound serine protease (ClpP class)
MSWFLIFLIGLGVLLLFIEIALLPGFGAAGIPGVVLIVAGIGLVWMQFGLRTGLTYASATVALTIPLAVLGLWLFPRTRLGRSFILNIAANSTDGFQAPPQDLVNLVGKSGKSITPLRPAGAALINDQRVDVVTLGDFINADVEIEVILVEGSRVVVRSL